MVGPPTSEGEKALDPGIRESVKGLIGPIGTRAEEALERRCPVEVGGSGEPQTWRTDGFFYTNPCHFKETGSDVPQSHGLLWNVPMKHLGFPVWKKCEDHSAPSVEMWGCLLPSVSSLLQMSL